MLHRTAFSYPLDSNAGLLLNKDMPKVSSHKVKKTHTLYLVIIVGLILLVLAVSAKYLAAKKIMLSYNSFVTRQAAQSAAEQAKIIATTITTQPSISSPLYRSPAQLEAYIILLSKQLERDIVVIDTNRKILADTFSANVGSIYTEDDNKAVDLALRDGKQGTFVENSRDYPKGIPQVVIPLLDTKGQTIGAVILSLNHTQ